ncbi:MAG: hypothetical protein U9N18_01925 [Campylobacterota bacterium]|nr:hypothetical protein [Campylobacterota bacterium]
MKKLVGILAAMIVMLMVLSNVSFAQGSGWGMKGGSVYGGYPGCPGYGYYGNRAPANPSSWAYSALVRASNRLTEARGYASSVEDGKTLITKAEKYCNTANSFYKQKNYTQALDYAIASLGLSRAVIHLYRAKNPTALPSPPPVQ